MINVEIDRKIRANELRQLRKDSGLTQEQLCDISRVCTKTISKMERGLVSWSIDTELTIRVAIRKYLNVA